MPSTKRIFIPFGELSPDAREFNNDGLSQAVNVAPIGDTYIPSQTWLAHTTALVNLPRGLHAHASTSGNTWYGYWGNTTDLYEASNTNIAAWTVAAKTRAAGGPYTLDQWVGASFGGAVLMTNYADDPQLLTSPAAANFVKLAQSGSGNPGMDPKAKFAFPVRNNMFLAYLNLASGFDGLSSGANPTTVCWSQTDNIRQYGSFNVTPQLTGTGYQPLLYDLGAITGGIGGQYGLVSMQRGWARIDGPPYTFRPISQGVGNLCPNGIVRFDDDVYFWGPSGPMVFRGGEGPAIPITKGKLAHTLTDFSFDSAFAAGVYSGADTFNISVAADHLNRHIWWSYPAATETPILIYDVDTDRFSFETPRFDGALDKAFGALFLQTRPEQTSGWCPGRDLVALCGDFSTGNVYYLGVPYRSASSVSCVLEKGYMQFDEDVTTRVTRVRPIYSMVDNSILPTATIEIRSKNKPFETPAVQTYMAPLDTHGWISTPDTLFADFHRIKLTLLAIPSRIAEIAGLEVEIATGGAYAA
jgi:hypothetical protein